jgi:hypothetical protein
MPFDNIYNYTPLFIRALKFMGQSVWFRRKKVAWKNSPHCGNGLRKYANNTQLRSLEQLS